MFSARVKALDLKQRLDPQQAKTVPHDDSSGLDQQQAGILLLRANHFAFDVELQDKKEGDPNA